MIRSGNMIPASSRSILPPRLGLFRQHLHYFIILTTSQNAMDITRDASDLDDQDRDTPLTHHDKLLLEALQNFIMPHIGADVDTSQKKEIIGNPISPKAKKLITAFKYFVSDIIRNSSKAQEIVVEVPLKAMSYTRAEKASEMPLDAVIRASTIEEKQSESSNSSDSAKPQVQASLGDVEHPEVDLLAQIDSKSKKFDLATFHAKVLLQLRVYINNKMPIRLLRFVPKGDMLEISLIGRDAMYEYIAALLQERKHDSNYRPFCERGQRQGPHLTQRGSESDDAAISRILYQHTQYAVLSHTWLRTSAELTYENWKTGSPALRGPGYEKLINFCRVVHEKHLLNFGWMDTVCINKGSSSELDESIRSMYSWYERSRVCIAYLAGTRERTTMGHDSWFTRGWTLQELLAPGRLEFYSQNWGYIMESYDDKIGRMIEDATSITGKELSNIAWTPLSRRMELAARREVTREEDTAYSLMGLFKVSMSTAYGEGAHRAFHRLLQEILRSKPQGVLDLFNWAGNDGHSAVSKILPVNPRQYLTRSCSISLEFSVPLEPLTLTHIGLRIPVLLMPGIYIGDNTKPFKPHGAFGALVSISPLGVYNDMPTVYHLLDHRVLGTDSFEGPKLPQITFAVFSVEHDTDSKGIRIPQKCIAFPLLCKEPAGEVTSTGHFKRIYTAVPVTFDMMRRNRNQNDELADDYMVMVDSYFVLQQEELANHGMQLISKYL